MSIPTVSSGTDWSALSIIGIYWDGIKKRANATNSTGTLGAWSSWTPAAGYDVQLTGLFNTMQTWVETNYNKFSDYYNHDLGDSTISTFPARYTRSTFNSRTGLPSSGSMFRRKAPGVDTYGKMQDGDYIGEWIFDDLKAAMDAMYIVEYTDYGSSALLWTHYGNISVGGIDYYQSQWGSGLYEDDQSGQESKILANAANSAIAQTGAYYTGDYSADYGNGSLSDGTRPYYYFDRFRSTLAPTGATHEDGAYCVYTPEQQLRVQLYNYYPDDEPAGNLYMYAYYVAPPTPTAQGDGVGNSYFNSIEMTKYYNAVDPTENTWARLYQAAISDMSDSVYYKSFIFPNYSHPSYYTFAGGGGWPTAPDFPGINLLEDNENVERNGWRVTNEKVFVLVTDWDETA